MDYKEKFEDFLDKMQGLLDNAKKQGHIIVRVEDLENAFPELMESDDENKPNGGIVMEDFNDGNGFYKVNLAYLNEKQVEEIEELVKKWNPELKESEDELTWLTKYIEEEAYSLSMDIRDNEDRIKLKKLQKALAWLEKQGDKDKLIKELGEYKVKYIQEVLGRQLEKQKEPELSEDLGEYITELSKQFPEVSFAKLSRIAVRVKNWFEKQGNVARLWTIQDAKKGDILADKYGVYIYDQLDIFDESACVSICGYQYSDKKFEPESMICNKSDFYPATKEQRDLLFQKMHEAGYTFDFEKKELKKVDNEEVNGEDYGIDGLWHAQRILEKTLGSVDGYQSDDGILDHRAAITAVKKLHKQKTDWSEEDSVRLQRIIDFLWYNRKGDTDAIYQQEQDIDWLKSLKNRVQPHSQPAWSEEDEDTLAAIIAIIRKQYNGTNIEEKKYYNVLINWLKSLKDRVYPKQEWKQENTDDLYKLKML